MKRLLYLTAILLPIAGCGPIMPTQSLEQTLNGAVIDPSGREVAPAYVLNTDYLLLYFSAHWCPPCRAFTPELVKFYEEYQGGLLFQTLFISNDNTEKEMRDYMKEANMPWPAVIYHSKATKKLNKRYSGQGIPRLVLVDRQGKVLADSFKGNKYLGPQAVLEELKKHMQKRKVDPPGISEETGNDLTPPKKLVRKYEIGGFGVQSGKRMVIIDGTVYTVGEKLPDGEVISAITESYIEVTVEGNRYRLEP